MNRDASRYTKSQSTVVFAQVVVWGLCPDTMESRRYDMFIKLSLPSENLEDNTIRTTVHLVQYKVPAAYGSLKRGIFTWPYFVRISPLMSRYDQVLIMASLEVKC